MRILPFLLLAACANSGKAENYAREYASLNFPDETVQNVTCEVSDSDGNGRVRCNLSLRGEHGTHVENIDCPAGWLWQPTKTTCLGIKGLR